MRMIFLVSLVALGCGGATVDRACGSLDVVTPVTATADCPCLARSPQAQSDYAPGQPVDLLFQGSWYPATVVGVVSASRWEVAYDGYGPDWNRLAGPDHLRPRQATASAPTPQYAGRPITTASELQQGMPIMVEFGGSWYDGHVRATTQGGEIDVSYDGYDSSWDETVGLARVRHRLQ